MLGGTDSGFDVKEFVHPVYWGLYGIDSVRYIDAGIMRAAMEVRKVAGVGLVSNTWHKYPVADYDKRMDWGIVTINRGIRLWDSQVMKQRVIARFGVAVATDWERWTWFREVGAEMSKHRFGGALDLVGMGMGAEAMRQMIREQYSTGACFGQWVGRIEKGVEWLHIDNGFDGSGKLSEFANS
jgi:hypothetical protein